MILNDMEKVGTSLPDVQSREMQILEEENDANMQQKFNTSTCSACNKDATDKYISCSECHIQIYYRCTDERSYRHTSFTILLKRKANTHVLITRQQT